MLHRTPMSMIKKQFVPNKPRRSLSPSMIAPDKKDEVKEPIREIALRYFFLYPPDKYSGEKTSVSPNPVELMLT